jgi:RNA polymerase sigma-70 factor (ECF subfamily)
MAADLTLDSAAPTVVKTAPAAEARDVDPALAEIQVTFSKPMKDGSWSWSTSGNGKFPDTTGKPHYLADGRTCVLPVKLIPGTAYAIWLNSQKFKNFKDANGTPAVPYHLVFTTRGTAPAAPAAAPEPGLDESQRKIVAWTDRQFRSFLDARQFAGWSAKEKTDLATRLIDSLKGPKNREYYEAICSLAALGATNALPALREIAFDRADKDNRDRWMAVRAIGLLGDKPSVPELINLVYHGNTNTRWWAQISLVRLTGQNFGSEWNAWGKWWNESGGQPAWKPEIIKWWKGQAEDAKLAETLADSDKQFLDKIQ